MRRRCQKAVHNEDAHQLNYLCDHFIHFHDRLKVKRDNLVNTNKMALGRYIKNAGNTFMLQTCY